MFLHVMPTGSKIWRVAYRADGKQTMLTFGKYPVVTMAQAREKCLEACKLIAVEVNPVQKRRDDKLAAVKASQTKQQTKPPARTANTFNLLPKNTTSGQYGLPGLQSTLA